MANRNRGIHTFSVQEASNVALGRVKLTTKQKYDLQTNLKQLLYAGGNADSRTVQSLDFDNILDLVNSIMNQYKGENKEFENQPIIDVSYSDDAGVDRENNVDRTSKSSRTYMMFDEKKNANIDVSLEINRLVATEGANSPDILNYLKKIIENEAYKKVLIKKTKSTKKK